MLSVAENLQALIVGLVLLALFACFVREWLAPDVAVLVAVAVLLLLRLLSPQQVLGVFSNSAPITIACLFIISGALVKTGCIDKMGEWLGLAALHSERRLLLVLMLGALLVSPFVNNTPFVMVMIPAVVAVANRHGLAPSRLLIPLSYATILGGLITMVGTSTNILVDGVARSLGLAPFQMFEISWPALLIALAGTGFLLLLAPRLLPVRETLTQLFTGSGHRLFSTELQVPAGSRWVGRSLKDAGLTGASIEVLKILRDEVEIAAPPPQVELRAGDRLLVHSPSGAMMDLRSTDFVSLPGMEVAGKASVAPRRDVLMVEAIIGQTSRYALRPIRELDLTARYGIHLIAVHRRSASIQNIGDEFELQFGDVLLVEGAPDQIKRFCDNGDLFALGKGREPGNRRRLAPIALASIAAVMLLAALRVMPIEGLAMIGAAVVIITGCIRADEAYQSIEWPIIVMIFGMLAIGVAMQESGLVTALASGLVDIGSGLSPWMMLSLIILIVSIATEFISNSAVAVIFTPIVIGVAGQLGVDPRPFVVAVMFAASLSFATPIGYQTNTLVYSAGNYRFSDFARMGVPLNIITWLLASLLIPLFWPLQPV